MRRLSYWVRYVLARYGSARVVAILCALIAATFALHAIAAPASVFPDVAAQNGPNWYQVLTAPIPTYDPSYPVTQVNLSDTPTPTATPATPAAPAQPTDTPTATSGTTIIIINTTVIQQTVNGATAGKVKHHRTRRHRTRRHRTRRHTTRRHTTRRHRTHTTRRHRKA